MTGHETPSAPPRISDRAVPLTRLTPRTDAGRAAGPRPDRPSRDAIDARYQRQTRLEHFGEIGQQRLGASRVAVIGAGGLGAPVLTYLAAAGVGSITVIDPDTVDATNLHRQVLFTGEDIGRSKAEAAAERLSVLNPLVRLRAVVDTVTTATAFDLLRGHDIVLDGTDNFPTRYLASDACEMLDIPLVWGSILAFAGQVSVFWGAGGRGVTYRDVHPVPPRPGEVPSCAEAGVLGMLCGVIGSTMAMEAVKVLTGMGEVLFGRLALYDALSARWDHIPISRDPGREPVTRLEDLTLTCGLPGPTGPARDEVHAAELPPLIAAGVRVIDIREDHEVACGMIAGAEHLPMSRLLAQLRGAGSGGGPSGDGGDGRKVRPGPGGSLARRGSEGGDATVDIASIDGAVLYCAAGTRSSSTQRILAEHGVSVRSLAGGFTGLEGSGGSGVEVVRPG